MFPDRAYWFELQITRTQAYYVVRHFSQFVDQGATVVRTNGGDAVAFKNPDGSLVAVLYSAAASSNYVVAIGGKKLQFSVPAADGPPSSTRRERDIRVAIVPQVTAGSGVAPREWAAEFPRGEPDCARWTQPGPVLAWASADDDGSASAVGQPADGDLEGTPPGASHRGHSRSPWRSVGA